MIDNSSNPAVQHNLTEYSVSEISQAVKRTLEGSFDRIRIRGEVSRPNYHGSGHLYFTMKDDGAAIDAVCWRGIVGRLSLKVEEGMEVICTGRISSYPRSSKYQVVVESVELAGEGALLKLLEDRRKKLAAEGLFDPERKQPLPFLPTVVGVVTSPTGAVIRDILHRLEDRFPRHVLLWPVPVQGEGAAEKIAAAIDGFNALDPAGPVPRPDVLIVGRGGGSLEDLWCFNEEVVVRATASSAIPLISAVGHETDTTLIDHAADRRAPTPTAAAEIAVPVRAEISSQVLDLGRRMIDGVNRLSNERRLRLEGLARGLPDPRRLLEQADLDLDVFADKLRLASENYFRRRVSAVNVLAAELRRPDQLVAAAGQNLSQFDKRLRQGLNSFVRATNQRYDGLSVEGRLASGATRALNDARTRFGSAEQLLESLSYERVLNRGYAVIRDAKDIPLTRRAEVVAGDDVEIQFADGRVGARLHGDGPTPRKKRAAKPPRSDEPQGTLL